jgi:hypothetical protein
MVKRFLFRSSFAFAFAFFQLQEFGSRYESEVLRSSKSLERADLILYVFDSSDTNSFSYISNLRVRRLSVLLFRPSVSLSRPGQIDLMTPPPLTLPSSSFSNSNNTASNTSPPSFVPPNPTSTSPNNDTKSSPTRTPNDSASLSPSPSASSKVLTLPFPPPPPPALLVGLHHRSLTSIPSRVPILDPFRSNSRPLACHLSSGHLPPIRHSHRAQIVVWPRAQRHSSLSDRFVTSGDALCVQVVQGRLDRWLADAVGGESDGRVPWGAVMIMNHLFCLFFLSHQDPRKH